LGHHGPQRRQVPAQGLARGVSGKLAQDEWADKETGEKRSKHYINANQVSFLDRAPAPAQAAAAEAPGGIEPF
jgi:hypothetical protein